MFALLFYFSYSGSQSEQRFFFFFDGELLILKLCNNHRKFNNYREKFLLGQFISKMHLCLNAKLIVIKTNWYLDSIFYLLNGNNLHWFKTFLKCWSSLRYLFLHATFYLLWDSNALIQDVGQIWALYHTCSLFFKWLLFSICAIMTYVFLFLWTQKEHTSMWGSSGHFTFIHHAWQKS